MREPLFGQAYNRYSYVLNNPLRYTDPSGFLPDEWLTEPRAQRAQEAANNAADRPPPAEVLWKVKRKPGAAPGPEGGGQPAASGETSDSEGHSAATGATAQPTTASRAWDVAKSLALRGARNTPITGLVVRIAEAVGEELAETGQDDPITIGEIAALYAVKDAVNKPFGIIEGTALDIATVGADVRAVGDAGSVEDKIEAGLDAAEKIARIATVAYGGARGVQGMVQGGEGRAAARASEIHRAVGEATQRRTTIAVTETAEGTRVISSSERTLRPAQRALLGPGEVEGVGSGHAEVTGVEAAKRMGLTPTRTAASRPICGECRQYLEGAGVLPTSPLRSP